uniref:Uncharacterized protein n=1 Tax=Arundo donax TaxID=35708 RepID=A0A0A9A4Y3_ARUDO
MGKALYVSYEDENCSHCL